MKPGKVDRAALKSNVIYNALMDPGRVLLFDSKGLDADNALEAGTCEYRSGAAAAYSAPKSTAQKDEFDRLDLGICSDNGNPRFGKMDDDVLDAKDGGNIGQFIWRSANPNLGRRDMVQCWSPTIVRFYAIRDILRGEELTRPV